MDKRNSAIGVSQPRVDAPAKVSGATRYLTDIVMDRMVHAYPVFSRIPFGRLVHVDAEPARKTDGFLAWLSAGDVPGLNQVGVIIEDQPLLAEETVRFIGDVIGVIVAQSPESAYIASRRVDVLYEEYEPLFTIEESEQASVRSLHASNTACGHQVEKGDPVEGFAQADLVVEEVFFTPSQEHYYLEPQGCIAVPNDDGGVTIYGSLQCPYYVQRAVSRVLGLPMNNVRVIQTPTGGAFGGKEDVPSEICARAALAAFRVGRPVKMVYRRRDDVQLTSKRHPLRMRYRVGVTRDGLLTAAEIRLDGNSGAYATLSPVVSYRAAMQAMGPYRVPHVRVDSTFWYTNLPPAGAFRGFGSPQAAFGHERIMDIIAGRLGMDPVEFRLKNVLEAGDTTLTGHQLSASVGIGETVRRAAEAADWGRERETQNEDNRYRTGIGIAATHYGNCLGAAGWPLDGAGAKLQLHRDGSVSVSFGLVEMGQGALTVVAQMTAEAVGVAVANVHVTPTDTRNLPDSGPSVASRNVVMTGNAIRDAARKTREVLHEAAAELLKARQEDIVIEDSHVRNKTNDTEIPFSELTEHLYRTNRRMDFIGWWHVPHLDFNAEKGYGEAYFTYSYATHIAKVRVDTLTGRVRVEKIWAAHDVGRAINPAGIEGQVEGGTAQGIGWALLEHFQADRGVVTTANLSTYLLPTSLDVGEVETEIVEDPEPDGPWGAKGIGEPAIIPTAAAIANAVSHAVGAPFNKLPVSPETVLRELSQTTGTDKC